MLSSATVQIAMMRAEPERAGGRAEAVEGIEGIEGIDSFECSDSFDSLENLNCVMGLII